MSGPTPLLDFFKRGEVARDVKMLAAEGAVAPRAHEQLAILMLLVKDSDAEIRDLAEATLRRIPEPALAAFLARSDVPAEVRIFFAERGVHPAALPAADADAPLVDKGEPSESEPTAVSAPDVEPDRESITQQLASMTFTQRLKAAVKGSREIRALLVRDPNKMIAAAVLSSPKLTDQEVETFSRMANVTEDVLRIIGANRSWTKNYGVIVGLTRNPKTPIGLSMNLLSRLNDRDVQMISMDRNVPGSLRIAARKKIVDAASKK